MCGKHVAMCCWRSVRRYLSCVFMYDAFVLPGDVREFMSGLPESIVLWILNVNLNLLMLSAVLVCVMV